MSLCVLPNMAETVSEKNEALANLNRTANNATTAQCSKDRFENCGASCMENTGYLQCFQGQLIRTEI